MNLVLFKLQTIHDSSPINRFYSVRAGQDLLGDWIVVACYGRLGTKGHARTWLCMTQQEAQKRVRYCLARRFSSIKRIGVNYTLTYVDIHPSLNPNDWYPFK